MDPESIPFSLKIVLKSGQIVAYAGEVGVRVDDGALLVSRDAEVIAGFAPGAWESFGTDNQ